MAVLPPSSAWRNPGAVPNPAATASRLSVHPNHPAHTVPPPHAPESPHQPSERSASDFPPATRATEPDRAAARRATTDVPGRFQMGIEMLVGMVHEEAKGIIPNETTRKFAAPLALDTQRFGHGLVDAGDPLRVSDKSQPAQTRPSTGFQPAARRTVSIRRGPIAGTRS